MDKCSDMISLLKMQTGSFGACCVRQHGYQKVPLHFSLQGASVHYKHAYQRKELVRKHYRGDVDYFAVYSPDLQKAYLIPITDVEDTMNALRLVPTKNNQTKHIRWAKEHELYCW